VWYERERPCRSRFVFPPASLGWSVFCFRSRPLPQHRQGNFFMRRIILHSVVLLLLSVPSAQAQTCQGLASFAASRLQLTGDASLTGESSALGGGLAYGLPQGPFGEAAVARRAHENYGGSSLDVSAAAGYDFAFGHNSLVHLCPLAGAAVQLGPNNTFSSSVERSRQSAQLGLTLGAELTPERRWNVIPLVALSYAYQRDQAKDRSGDLLFRIDDSYVLAQLGLGLVFKSTISLRPYIDLPLWLEGGEPSVGLTVGYSLGKRSR
jgi:hypothetical protein